MAEMTDLEQLMVEMYRDFKLHRERLELNERKAKVLDEVGRVLTDAEMWGCDELDNIASALRYEHFMMLNSNGLFQYAPDGDGDE